MRDDGGFSWKLVRPERFSAVRCGVPRPRPKQGAAAGPVRIAVFADTCGNLIQIYQMVDA